jgi:hypothetical protein
MPAKQRGRSRPPSWTVEREKQRSTGRLGKKGTQDFVDEG